MPESPAAPYRVLARAYRPTRLSELIGQETLVRTLTNALASGRIAHAFLLSGIRGVGKTTTARIIARALNCTGPDGQGGPTPEPCGVCPSCRSIAADNALDVIEMDAATQTGIDSIREIVDSVRYAPSAARYKIYIIDEVHMLSMQAFNGLLKTLEEPPPHVKFVFATTEARRVPVTVLSRCQRFDLRRVEPEVLASHLAAICAKESVAAEPEALALIARAAEGSVRDSLSLLDQGIAMGEGAVAVAAVREMLGLADQARLVRLFDAVTGARPADALVLLDELAALGADPVVLLQDLLEISHWLSRQKVGVADAGSRFVAVAAEDVRVLAERLSMGALSRAWQMLLRGIDEVRAAPDAMAAAEMILLRLATASELPPPGELMRLMQQTQQTQPAGAAVPPARGTPPPTLSRPPPAGGGPLALAEPAPQLVPVARPQAPAEPEGFAELVAALFDAGEKVLAASLTHGAHLIRFEPGVLEFRYRSAPDLMPDLANRLGSALERITGRRWLIVLGNGQGEPTLAEQAETRRQERLRQLAGDPELRAVLDSFPGAALVEVRPALRPTITGGEEP